MLGTAHLVGQLLSAAAQPHEIAGATWSLYVGAAFALAAAVVSMSRLGVGRRRGEGA